jgi:hypothetical protein
LLEPDVDQDIAGLGDMAEPDFLHMTDKEGGKRSKNMVIGQ